MEFNEFLFRSTTRLWICVFCIIVFTSVTITSKTVDLSNKKMKKEDFFVKLQGQMRLHEVTDLILRNNEFDSFLDCSTNLDNLKTLDLSQNHLQRFFFLCKEEYNLEALNVSHNRLEYIDDSALNERTPKLKVLDLSDNRLFIVNETMLQYLKVLEDLSVANNPIGDAGLHENSLTTLQELKNLNLRNISVTFFPAGLFRTLTNLKSLDLSWNPIETIPALPPSLEKLDISGTNIQKISNFSLPQLRELIMDNMNNLTSFVLNDLQNLTSLEILSLNDCAKLIDVKVLPPSGTLLPNLNRLYLKSCSLSNLDEYMRPILQKLSVLDLRNNPWKCDCNMKWIPARNLSKELGKEIRCVSPANHDGKLLSEIPENQLECEYETNSLYPTIWTGVSLLVLISAMTGTLLLFRRPISQYILRKKSGNTVSYKNVIESSNDLVRILPVGDIHERNDE